MRYTKPKNCLYKFKFTKPILDEFSEYIVEVKTVIYTKKGGENYGKR